MRVRMQGLTGWSGRRAARRAAARRCQPATRMERLEARWARAADLDPGCDGDPGVGGSAAAAGEDQLAGGVAGGAADEATLVTTAAIPLRPMRLGTLRDTGEWPVRLTSGAARFTFTTRGIGGRLDRIVLEGRGLEPGTLQMELVARLPDGSLVPVGFTTVEVDPAVPLTRNPTQIPLSGLPAGRYELVIVHQPALTPAVGGAIASAPETRQPGRSELSVRIDAPALDARSEGRDDGDDSRETATPLGTARRRLTARSRFDDSTDWFSFTIATSGTRDIVLRHKAPARAFSVVELQDAAGQVVGRSSGPGGVHALRDVQLAPGDYFVRLSQSVGGKSAIRSPGRYTLAVEIPAAAPAGTATGSGEWMARAASGSRVDGWIASLPTRSLQPLVRQAVDGERVKLDRQAMLDIFAAVGADDVVSKGEYRSLTMIVRDHAVVEMPDFVRNLSHKTVVGNVANREFQGEPLGNLRPGSPGKVLSNLVAKWFRGDDPPLSAVDKKTGQPIYPTLSATGSLFGPSGSPSVDDISQGDTGDCYFLSSLGTVVSRMNEPEGSKVIALRTADNPEGMFIANDDGTYTVRLYRKARSGADAGTWVADYVTVNDEFLVDPNGGTPEWLYANAYGVFNQSANILWVAYAEKAFVQMNTSGVWQKGWQANDYESINGTYYASVMLMAITGRDGYESGRDLSSVTFEDIVTAYDKGVGAVFSTTVRTPPVDGSNTNDVPLVTNHDYMMIGYDANARTIRLRNPWGDALDSAGYTSVRGTYDAVTGSASDPGYTSLEILATIEFLGRNYDDWFHA